jgi:CheY-like chemotaxis protein
MCSILIVEDDPASREVVVEWLVQEGHEVEHAADGIEALDKLAGDRPCLILVDLRMPRMDGWELTAVLRSHPRLATIPVIVMSEQLHDGDRPPVLAATAYWPKPVELAQLATVTQYCTVHQNRRS